MGPWYIQKEQHINFLQSTCNPSRLHMRRKIRNQNENDFYESRAGATLIYFPAIFSCFTIQSDDLLTTTPVSAKLCHAIVHFPVHYDR